MNMDTVAPAPVARLGFLDKLRVLLACGVAIVLMRSVGWRVAAPLDPDMAVTLTQAEGGVWAVWPALLILTAVTATIGTVIAGQRLPEAGIFAAGFGLTALALRGGYMQDLLAYHGASEASQRRALMAMLAWDCVLWAAILAVSWLAVMLARAWLWGPSEVAPGPDGEISTDAASPGKKSAPSPSPRPSSKSTERPGRKQQAGSSTPRGGWPALPITIVIGALVIWLTIARTPVAQIARGQVIASVAAGLLLGAMAARYFTGIADPRWYVLAVPAIGLIGYLLGFINAGMGWAQKEYQPYALLAVTPTHDLARPLPIEYVAVGVSAALVGFWSGQRIEHTAEQEST